MAVLREASNTRGLQECPRGRGGYPLDTLYVLPNGVWHYIRPGADEDEDPANAWAISSAVRGVPVDERHSRPVSGGGCFGRMKCLTSVLLNFTGESASGREWQEKVHARGNRHFSCPDVSEGSGVKEATTLVVFCHFYCLEIDEPGQPS